MEDHKKRTGFLRSEREKKSKDYPVPLRAGSPGLQGKMKREKKKTRKRDSGEKVEKRR